MPPTTAYSFGDVILVPFPFTDQTGTKKRPAVVEPALTIIEKRLVLKRLGQLQLVDVKALRKQPRADPRLIGSIRRPT